MSFVYPLGLLGLLAIPILILIYIIKNKYTEKVVSSNYLWKMSERFMKKRNPLREINGIISFLLQLICIIVISFTIARPIFTVPGGADKYEFILDGTASMQIRSDDVSRFENAKNLIKNMVNSAGDGSEFTLIYAGETTSKLSDFQSNKKKFLEVLENVTPTTMSYRLDDAISIAQNDFDIDKSINIYLFSDKYYTPLENITLVNVSNGEENYALTSLKYTLYDSAYSFTTTVQAYEHASSKTIELYIDDVLLQSKTININAKEESEVKFQTILTSFKKAECKIKEDDALDLDNSFIKYFEDNQFESKVLLVSDSPFYLYSALKVLKNVTLTVLSSTDYENQYGYDVYIFDCWSPQTLPTDGSIWFVGVKDNIPDSGFTIQEEIVLDSAGYLEYEDSNDEIYKKITKNIFKNDIALGTYVKYSLISSFTTILSLDNYPVLSVGTMSNSFKEVVVSFDLHKSNLPLLADFTLLVKNLIAYSHLSAVETTSYICGDKMVIDKVPNCTSIKLVSPAGNVAYFDMKVNSMSVLLTEVGNYRLSVLYETETKEYDISVTFPTAESNPLNTDVENATIIGTKEEIPMNGEYDSFIIVIVALIVFALLDWMVYLNEQHQLQ